MRLPVEALLAQRMQAPGMRSLNGIQLLNLIRDTGPVSRATLAKLSGLSKPTVSEQISRLISFGVVVERGQGTAATTGGKRPTMVGFNSEAGRVAGVGIGPEITHVALADLQGEVKSRADIRTQAEQGPRRLLERIVRSIASLAARDTAGLKLVRAIGLGVPGRVDCDRGVVLESGNVFGWTDVDVASPLSRSFGCPVVVDNDVNVALVAELNHGAARSVDTAVLVRLDTGIGAAVAMNRQIHHGSHWAAGEIGHLAPDRADLKHVSPRGQLESVVGADEIARRVRSAARKSVALRRVLREQGEIAALFVAASQRDPVAASIAADITHHLAVAVAHQALAYDPDVVLLSGEVFRHVLDDIREFLSRTIPWSPQLVEAECGEEAVLRGAADTALVSVYEQMSRQLQADAATA